MTVFATSADPTPTREPLISPVVLKGRSQQVLIETPIALAPMAGVTDRPFRNLCHRFGAGLVVAEMISSKPELRGSRKSNQRRILPDDPEPRAIQLLGNEPEDMAEAARIAVDQGAQIIDINLGCPAKKVCRKAAGSALMAEPETVGAILKAVVDAVPCPVTLKMRTGPDSERRNAPELARMAEDCGVAMLSIHGRTRADKYLGEAEYETIARVVDTVSIPVLANGDIDTPEKALWVLQQTSAAGIMIGRPALGQPWLFAALRSELLRTGGYFPPDITERYALFEEQLLQIHDHYGEILGPRIARKHLGWYADALALDADTQMAFKKLETAEQQLFWLREQRGMRL